MQILPVLDLKGGRVVRAVAGQREKYREVVSTLCTSSDPVVIARAFRENLGLTQLYVADLDAIGGDDPNDAIVAQLASDGFRVWVDAGIKDVSGALRICSAGAHRIVAGLETLAGPEALAEMVRQIGSDRIVLSLDLRDGQPLGDLSGWRGPEPLSIAKQATACGVTTIIVLDLVQVGTREGLVVADLVRNLVKQCPQVEFYAGGGVRNRHDLRQAKECGLKGILVATALHDGTLQPQDWLEEVPHAPDTHS